MLNPAELVQLKGELARQKRRQSLGWVAASAAIIIAVFFMALLLWQQQRLLGRTIAERDAALATLAEIERTNQTAEAALATAILQNEEAEQRSQMALSRQLAAQAQMLLDEPQGDLVLATLLSIESLRRGPSLQNRLNLRRTLPQLPRPAAQLLHDDQLAAVAFSPDGRWLMTQSGSTVTIWTGDGSQKVAELVPAGSVKQASFSPDGRWLATASSSQIVAIWEAATGREVGRLRHREPIQAIAFSADGRWLATQGQQTAYVWPLTAAAADNLLLNARPERVARAEVQLALKRLNRGEPPKQTVSAIVGQGYVQMSHDSPITALALSPDGRWLATAATDRQARLWEVANGREVTRLAHQGTVYDLTFSPDGRLLVTAGADRLARVWWLRANDRLEVAAPALEPVALHEAAQLAHPSRVRQVKFSPDIFSTRSYWLATIADDDLARVWVLTSDSQGQTFSAREAARMAHADQIKALTFSPGTSQTLGSRWLATASLDGTAQVWLSATGRPLARMNHPAGVTDVAFSPDGRWLVTAGGRTAQVWEATIGYEVVQKQYADSAQMVDFAPQPEPDDTPWLATQSGQVVQIWEATTGREIAHLGHDRYITTMAFSPAPPLIADQSNSERRWLATGSYRTIEVWAIEGGDLVTRLFYNNLVRSLAFSPDGRWLAAAGLGKVVGLWETVAWQQVAQLDHGHQVNALAFSPNGEWLATAGDDKLVHIWQVASGHEVTRIPHDGSVKDVAFSPDGQWLATASSDRLVRLFVADTVRETARLPHADGLAAGLAFSPDGRWLATRSGSWVRTWAVPGGEAGVQMEHNAAVTMMTFSPDSRMLATTSGDRLAHLWDVASGQELDRLPHEYRVNWAAFSPNGRWLATASADHLAQVWLLRPADLTAEVCRRLPRNLKLEEWHHYLGDEPYRPTCANLPALTPEE